MSEARCSSDEPPTDTNTTADTGSAPPSPSRLSRYFDRTFFKELLPLATGMGVVGMSFGAITVSSGMQWWHAVAMSVFVYGGSAQFAAIGITAAGGSLIAAVVTGLLLNARHIPYGLAIGSTYWRGWKQKILGTHWLIDQSTAFVLTSADETSARKAFWTTGVTLFVFWNVGTVIGALGGQFITDPALLGLDAAMPAALLALIIPALKNRNTLLASLVGVAIAVAVSPFVPAGIPVLLGLGGLLVAWPGTAQTKVPAEVTDTATTTVKEEEA